MGYKGILFLSAQNMHYYTDLNIWRGSRGCERNYFYRSVIESPCLFVCMCVTKVITILYGQMVIFLGMYGSKDSKSRRTSKLHDRLKSNGYFNGFLCPCFFGSGTSLLWIMGKSAAEGLWLLALLTGEMWNVTYDISHVTHDFFEEKIAKKVQDKSQKVKENAKLKKLPTFAQKDKILSKRQDFIASVLLSIHAVRVVVSRLRDLK